MAGWPPGHWRRSSDRIHLNRLRVLGEQDRGRLFIVARMVAGTTWFVCKAGTTKMTKTSTKVAGIDTGKAMLEVGTYPTGDSLQVANAGDGHKQLVAWLKARKIKRVGIEASGASLLSGASRASPRLAAHSAMSAASRRSFLARRAL